MFCKYCGNEIEENQAFCTSCGKKILDEKENNQKIYDGKLKKCPNCGELVDSFTARCKACGYEFRDTSVVSSINELKKSLEKINNSEQKDSMLSTALGYVGSRTSKMVEEIKSFNIPNTKEDIIELMFMASSNIIVDNSLDADRLYRVNDRAISEAWKSKMEQAYQKAKILLFNDPAFLQIEKIYLSKNKEIEIAKKSRAIKTTLLLVLLFVMFIAILSLPFIFLITSK